MSFNPHQSLGTGGLKDFDETERIQAKLRPLIEKVTKKAKEINVPIHIVVYNSMYTDSTGIGTSLVHICQGREENGNQGLPATIKALSIITQDINLAMKMVLKYTEQNNPIMAILKNAFGQAFSGTDESRETRGCDPLDCENCDKKDVCPIRPMVEGSKGMINSLKDVDMALKNLSDLNRKNTSKALMDKIIDDGAKLEDEMDGGNDA